MDPRTAVRARTIPVLTDERNALLKKLQAMERENLDVQAKMMENFKAMKANGEEVSRRLDLLDSVRMVIFLSTQTNNVGIQLEAKFASLPLDDLQEWALRTAETLPTKVVK